MVLWQRSSSWQWEPNTKVKACGAEGNLMANNSSQKFLGVLSGFIRVSSLLTGLHVFRLGFLSSLSRLRCLTYPLSFPLSTPTMHLEVAKSDAWGSNSTPHDTLLGTQISLPCREVVIDHNTVSESSIPCDICWEKAEKWYRLTIFPRFFLVYCNSAHELTAVCTEYLVEGERRSCGWIVDQVSEWILTGNFNSHSFTVGLHRNVMLGS